MKSKVAGGKGKLVGKKPVVNVGVRRERHVPECLVWPDPSATPGPDFPQTDRFIVSNKPELGKPMDRGYNLPTENSNPNVVCEAERDTAKEALRGWPQLHRHEEHHNELEDFMNGHGFSGGPVPAPFVSFADIERSTSQKKDKKKKGGKSSKNEKDPHIADLVSHRFLYEAAMERQLKEAERLQQEAEGNKNMRARRFPTGIKATKTSQLRSIALAEKVERSPSDLWQMSKFKDNAKTVLDTRRRGGGVGSGTGGMQGSAGDGAAGEAFATCTCEEEQSGYHGARKDRYTEYSPVDYDDARGVDQVPMSPMSPGNQDSGEILAL